MDLRIPPLTIGFCLSQTLPSEIQNLTSEIGRTAAASPHTERRLALARGRDAHDLTIGSRTADPRTTNLDFRGIGSRILSFLRGRVPRSLGIFTETQTQILLVCGFLVCGLASPRCFWGSRRPPKCYFRPCATYDRSTY